MDKYLGKLVLWKSSTVLSWRELEYFQEYWRYQVFTNRVSKKRKNKSGQKNYVFHMFPVLLVQPAVLDDSKKFSKQYESFGRKAGQLYSRLVTRNSKFSFSWFSYFSFYFSFFTQHLLFPYQQLTLTNSVKFKRKPFFV